MKNLVVLTGAGISAESGLKTFRGADGLWEGHRIEDVASPEGWMRNKALVLDFYNQRRRQLDDVEPNEAHKFIATLEQSWNVQVITQNVDDLHEQAGSSRVLHLHGELRKACSERNLRLTYEQMDDINLGDVAADGHQLRPAIVWFGEEVPAMSTAIDLVGNADVILIVGTSLIVYPAAGLVSYAPLPCSVIYIDPNPAAEIHALRRHVEVVAKKATKAVTHLKDRLEKLRHS